jgi:hypothetical protein
VGQVRRYTSLGLYYTTSLYPRWFFFSSACFTPRLSFQTWAGNLAALQHRDASSSQRTRVPHLSPHRPLLSHMVEMDPGLVLPDDPAMDEQEDAHSTSTSSSHSSTRRQPGRAVPPLEQATSDGLSKDKVKQEIERMERRNSIVDSDSGRISPPRTKGQWDAFIKRLVSGWILESDA